jgi:phosphate/sulfate permease
METINIMSVFSAVLGQNISAISLVSAYNTKRKRFVERRERKRERERLRREREKETRLIRCLQVFFTVGWALSEHHTQSPPH